jgi:hypothetical protein
MQKYHFRCQNTFLAPFSGLNMNSRKAMKMQFLKDTKNGSKVGDIE